MNRADIEQWITELLQGRLAREELTERLLEPRTARLNGVSLDLDRQRRCGFPEAVFGEGKSPATLLSILGRLLTAGQPVLTTRVSPDVAQTLLAEIPAGRYNPVARTFRVEPSAEPRPTQGLVAVITAGTTDLPVAEEARETLSWMGVETRLISDVGVAGPHRLPERLHELEGCDAIVVAAGMEAALPSVVAGYVGCPVIGVPTSVGYGANLGGLTALLSMLNSCAANVTVVNIDAGFKAGYVAGLIAVRAGSRSGAPPPFR